MVVAVVLAVWLVLEKQADLVVAVVTMAARVVLEIHPQHPQVKEIMAEHLMPPTMAAVVAAAHLP